MRLTLQIWNAIRPDHHVSMGKVGGDISRGTSAAQGAMTREEQLTAAAVQNAQATQEQMRALSGPGGGAAFMDPYQDAVINESWEYIYYDLHNMVINGS